MASYIKIFSVVGDKSVDVEFLHGRPTTKDGFVLRNTTWEQIAKKSPKGEFGDLEDAIRNNVPVAVYDGTQIWVQVKITKVEVTFRAFDYRHEDGTTGSAGATWRVGRSGRWYPPEKFEEAVRDASKSPTHSVWANGICLDPLLTGEEKISAQVLYDLREEYEFCSGSDLHEFFFGELGDPSPSGKLGVPASRVLRFVLDTIETVSWNSGK